MTDDITLNKRPVLEAILLRHLGDFETYLAEIASLRDT